MSKNVLILGASGEIGSAVAKEMADKGYSLVLHYHRNLSAVESLLTGLPEETVLAVITGDFSNNEGIETFLSKLSFKIDTIVFTAGNSPYGLFQGMTVREMDRELSVQVKALWRISHFLLPEMIREKKGNIVVISSVWGEEGASCEVIYSSVKGAQNSFIKALAKEAGSSGIRINGISPGLIDTKMNARFNEAEKQTVIEQIPLQRAGRPQEVAHLVSFLLSQQAAYIHGEIIKVSGGW